MGKILAEKKCTMCKQVKPRSEYNLRRKGGVQVQAKCKDCHKIWLKGYRQKNWARLNRKARERHRQRMLSDPDYAARKKIEWQQAYEKARADDVAKLRRRQRESSRVYREKNGVPSRGLPIPGQRRERVPTGPLRAILLSPRWAGTGNSPLGKLTGVDEAVIRRVRSGESTSIDLALADRILLKLDEIPVLVYADAYGVGSGTNREASSGSNAEDRGSGGLREAC